MGLHVRTLALPNCESCLSEQLSSVSLSNSTLSSRSPPRSTRPKLCRHPLNPRPRGRRSETQQCHKHHDHIFDSMSLIAIMNDSGIGGTGVSPHQTINQQPVVSIA